MSPIYSPESLLYLSVFELMVAAEHLMWLSMPMLIWNIYNLERVFGWASLACSATSLYINLLKIKLTYPLRSCL